MNNQRVAYDAQRTGTSMEQVEKKARLIGRRLEPDEIAPRKCPLPPFIYSEELSCV